MSIETLRLRNPYSKHRAIMHVRRGVIGRLLKPKDRVTKGEALAVLNAIDLALDQDDIQFVFGGRNR